MLVNMFFSDATPLKDRKPSRRRVQSTSDRARSDGKAERVQTMLDLLKELKTPVRIEDIETKVGVDRNTILAYIRDLKNIEIERSQSGRLSRISLKKFNA